MKADQAGTINLLLIPFILVDLMLIGAVGFGYWAYMSRQDYKNNINQKVTAIVTTKINTVKATDAKQYAEQAKQPLVTYTGPAEFGTIVVQYPKTWSAYISESNSGGGQPIEGYFQPGFVPDVNSQNNAFALRVELLNNAYSQVLQSFASQAQSGKIAIVPYISANIASNVFGVKITGQITPNTQGTMIVLPLRNMTFEMYTESSQFESDFNNIILPNFSFRP